MKKSVYEKGREAFWTEVLGSSFSTDSPKVYAQRDVMAAQSAGVTWDPEEEPEPEVLWEGKGEPGKHDYRITTDGKAWFRTARAVLWYPIDNPMARELARRIMAEREGCVPLCKEKIRSLEQQLSAQEQVEKSLRAEIRAMKSGDVGAWIGALDAVAGFLSDVEGSAHQGYYTAGWAGQQMISLRSWLRSLAS